MSKSICRTPSSSGTFRFRNEFAPKIRTCVVYWALFFSVCTSGSIQYLHAENLAAPTTGLDFRLFGSNLRDPAPRRSDVRTAFAEPPLAESLDFRVLGSPSKPDEAVPDPASSELDFRVLGPIQVEEVSAPTRVEVPKPSPATKKPIVYVYTADLRSCAPCKRLHDELNTLDQEVVRSLPFRFVWRSPPTWVKGTPTLHWNDGGGAGRTLEYGEWKGIEGFRRLFEATQRKKSAANTQPSTKEKSAS